MTNKAILILFVLLTSIQTFADGSKKLNNGVIKGVVADKLTNQPLAYSSIRLYTKSQKFIKGVITNDKGSFEIKNIEWGEYYALINFIGYKPQKLEVKISKTNPEYKLSIELEENTVGLDQINVIAEKKQMQSSVKKRVFNVGKNVTVEGGNTLDALQSIPAVNVDINGTISYRGSDNVMILIDGEQTALIGKGNNKGLEQIPSNMIDKIELISNPSAKYDAEGMSGIINIKLKKSEKKGTNTGFTLTAGLDEVLNASVLHSRTNKKMNLSLNMGINHKNFFQTKEHFRDNFGNPSANNYYNFDDMQMDKNFGNVNTSLGIKTGKKSNLKLSAMFNQEKSSADRHIDYQILQKNGDVENTFYKNIDSKVSGSNFNGSAIFNKKFNKKRSVKIYSSYSYARKETDMDNYRYQSTSDIKPDKQNTNAKYSNDLLKYGFDFKNRINSNSLIEAGYKGSWQNVENDFSSQSFDYALSKWSNNNELDNLFKHEEKINAVYTNFSGKLVGLNIDAGLRYEYSVVNVNSINKDEYSSLFPVITISKKLGKATLFAGYNKRINRPKLKMLNPYSEEYSDDWNTHTGNPYLKHELVHSIETGSMFKTKGANITATLYYRNIESAINRVKSAINVTPEQNPLKNIDNASIVTYVNTDKANLIGSEFTGSFTPFRFLDITSGVNIYYTILEENLNKFNDANKNLWGWNAKMNAGIKLPFKTKLQISANYRSKIPTVLETIKENYYFDLGISKKILKNRGVLVLKVSDIFDTSSYQPFVEEVNSNGFAYTQKNQRKIETRFIVLNFKYNFTSKNKKSKKKKAKFFWDELTK